MEWGVERERERKDSMKRLKFIHKVAMSNAENSNLAKFNQEHEEI